ncbi:hypothetical protein HOY80DRAFT_1091378, partial [Tuber brumale]
LLNNQAEQLTQVFVQVYRNRNHTVSQSTRQDKINDASHSKFATLLVSWRNAMSGVDERNPGF